VVHVQGGNLDSKRRGRYLNYGKLADGSRYFLVPEDRNARQAWENLFEKFQPFRTNGVAVAKNPVALPPGRAKLST